MYKTYSSLNSCLIPKRINSYNGFDKLKIVYLTYFFIGKQNNKKYFKKMYCKNLPEKQLLIIVLLKKIQVNKIIIRNSNKNEHLEHM